MIIVDSSVWIDFLNGRNTQHVRQLRARLGIEEVALGDLMLSGATPQGGVVLISRFVRLPFDSGPLDQPQARRDGPDADSRIAANRTLFDHLVGQGEHGRRNSEAERAGSLDVNHQFELGRLHNR